MTDTPDWADEKAQEILGTEWNDDSFWVGMRDSFAQALRDLAAEKDKEIAQLRAALTPSVDTKTAYMGEFQFGLPDTDENGAEFMRSVNVPWTTIKKIMERIGEYAAIRNQP